MKRKWRLPFAVLSDAGNAYAAELGLAFTLPEDLQQGLASNYGARLLPLLADLATTSHSFSHQFPLSKDMCLSLSSSK